MAAVDYFLKIEGVEGEAHDGKHKGEIDIQSWSFSEHQTGASSAGGGGGAGKVHMDDIHFTMHVNKASPKLWLACATGEHFTKATLVCRKAGKEQHEYLKIVLHHLLVSSFQMGGSASSDIVPVDQVALNFAKIEIEYKPQNPDGTLGGAVKGCYDLKTNQKC